MAFAAFGRLVAAGCLAVSVAHDECFPQRGGDGAGRAADVEHFGSAVGDDPADGAVAAEPFERGCGKPAGANVGVYLGEQLGGRTGQFVEVDDRRQMWSYGPAVADVSGVERTANQVRGRVGPTLGQQPGVAREG